MNTKNHDWKNHSKTAQCQRKRKILKVVRRGGGGGGGKVYYHPRNNNRTDKLLLTKIMEATIQWNDIFRLLKENDCHARTV